MKQFKSNKLASIIFSSFRSFHVDSQLIKTGFNPLTFFSNRQLQSLLQNGELSKARKLFDEMRDKNIFTFNRIISSYVKCGNINEARKLFDQTFDRTEVTWTIMIGAYAQLNQTKQSFDLFNGMRQSGISPDHVSIASILGSCQDFSTSNWVIQVHTLLVKFGFESNIIVNNTLLDSYCKCRRLNSAKKYFDGMNERDGVTYNAMVMGFSKEGFYEEAIELFGDMRNLSLQISQFTFSGILTAAAGLGDLELGQQVHSLIIRSNFTWNVFVNNSLLDFYSKCDIINEARTIFDQMDERDNVSYNVMISGYCWNGEKDKVMALVKEMEYAGYVRIIFPFPSLSSFVASIPNLELGKQIHGQTIITGAVFDDIVSNSLIDMYAKCGIMDMAELIFSNRKDQNTISWTSMISGHIENGRFDEAVDQFSRMRKMGLNPDRATFASVIKASASLASLKLGMQLHSNIIKSGNMSSVYTGCALSDMYAKCGCLEETYNIFTEMPEKNIVSWNAMMTALAHNGEGRKAIEMLDEMIKLGFKPDWVTFLSILSACNHSGLVDEGICIFESMEKLFMVKPQRVHYSCIVDLLGRVGRFDEVKELLNRIPFESDHIIWNSVLNSSRIHGNQELAILASEKLFSMELDEATPYVIMSNVYSKARKFEEAANVKKLMRDRGFRKVPGCSWVEIKNKVYTFSSNSDIGEEIRVSLKKLTEEITKAGYKPDTSCTHQNVDEDIKAESLMYHSERLAIAFALLHTPSNVPIRIMKNLRACTDCHAAIKLMSKVIRREIIVRDSSRFHHFRNGVCSCRDYWNMSVYYTTCNNLSNTTASKLDFRATPKAYWTRNNTIPDFRRVSRMTSEDLTGRVVVKPSPQTIKSKGAYKIYPLASITAKDFYRKETHMILIAKWLFGSYFIPSDERRENTWDSTLVLCIYGNHTCKE